jgi:hypothetical protein
MQKMTKPVSIELELKRLQRELNEALWNNDANATNIEAAIERLLFLQSMHETWDMPF